MNTRTSVVVPHPIQLVIFDLSGTTVHDDGYVTQCLARAAQETGIPATEAQIAPNIGTNKRHLFYWLIARAEGRAVALDELGAIDLAAEQLALADVAFARYEQHMIDLYRREVREVPGAEAAFRWLHERHIWVATDTGFHRGITEAIMERLGWLARGLVDVSLCVQDVPGERGRPAPYMIFQAMQQLGILSVDAVVKVGDQPADLLEGCNAGCAGVVGVLSGAMGIEILGRYRHTHIIPSVAALPALLEKDFHLPSIA